MPQPGAGEVLLRTLYLSLDPYMRGRMSDDPSYAAPIALGSVMVGSTVSRIETSRHADFQEGQLVLGNSGWQDYALSDGQGLTPLYPEDAHPSRALGVLGMPGFTAYMGLLDIGRPTAGETVVVAAASGAVGAVVGQIARIKGCHVVGIAGGEDKCSYVTDELGFNHCVDHHAEDFRALLGAACPDGIDVYFESVGGAVFDAVLPLLNTKARIPVCGLIAGYNATELPPGPDRLSLLVATVLRKRIRMQGFIIFDDYGPRWPEFAAEMRGWVLDGQVKALEDIIFGLESAPEALIGLLEGRNFGKLVIQVAHE